MRATHTTVQHVRPSWDRINTALCGAYWSRQLAEAVADDAPICRDCLRVQMEDHAAPMAVSGAGDGRFLSRMVLRLSRPRWHQPAAETTRMT